MSLRNTSIAGFAALTIACWNYFPQVQSFFDNSSEKGRTSAIELSKDTKDSIGAKDSNDAKDNECKTNSLEEYVKSIEDEIDKQKKETDSISESMGYVYFNYADAIIDQWSEKTDLYLNMDFIFKLNKFAEAEFYSKDILIKQKKEAVRFKSILDEYFAFKNDHPKNVSKKMKKSIDNIIYRIDFTLNEKSAANSKKPKKFSRVSDTEFNANSLLSDYLKGRVDDLLDTSEEFISIYDSIKAKKYNTAKSLNDDVLISLGGSAIVLKMIVYGVDNDMTPKQVEILGQKIDYTLNKISDVLYTIEA